MRVKVAIGLVVAFLATLLSVGPASAGVNVVVRNNGDVLINGDGGDNHVHVLFCGNGLAVVLYGEGDDHDFEDYEVVEVADDLTINLKGGNDNLSVGSVFDLNGGNGVALEELPEDCLFVEGSGGDEEHEYDVPGNLKIFGASGNDDVDLVGLYVGKDVTVSLSSGDNRLYMNYVHVGDDVTVRASGGRDQLDMYGFWIDDRLDVNLSAGNNEFYFSGGATARAIIRGHNGDDDVETGLDDDDGLPVFFGHNPIIITAGGSDYIDLSDFLWSGKLRLNTGSGGDGVGLDLDFDFDLEPTMIDDDAIIDLDTGSGDDHVHIYGDLIDGDDLNGGPGDDGLVVFEVGDATVKNFEEVNEIGLP